ncbi:FMR1-interacting protein NUFIP1 isoform X2 [Denticeps clupeoides]|uniref:FMR1-interacting protein NUFIP1 isoform X2 n=1 Tax=Denticeps clupeoides TaxID=299321 RepID=UPI0010A3F8CA|nr:nuclear fragile X mental retardation-interacting protein 1 isoform X2 [Denticeps clupeoides]
MTEPGNYPPPNFDLPSPGPFIRPAAFQWTPPEPGGFQATRDWNWFQQPPAGAAPPGLWNRSLPWRWQDPPNHQSGQFHKTWDRHAHQDWGGVKRNKREPEFSHFCDSCDRGFKHQEKYEEHIAQHVKCSIKDCSFTAHEKLVKIHFKNSHAPGAKRIKLDTPEEISKWREERRRNYPTLSNIEKKMKLKEAMQERGEVLETAQFGRMKQGRGRGRGRGRHNRGGRFHMQGRSGQNGQSSNTFGFQSGRSEPSKECDPLGALASSDPDSEKEDLVSKGQASASGVLKNMSSGLGALLASYGSMSENESDQEPEDLPLLKTKHLLEENQEMLKRLPAPPEQASSEGPRPGGCQPGSQRGRGGRGRGKARGERGRPPQQRHPTLLEMLLAPDIRHERNVILQCVRYVVRSKFFGLEAKHAVQKVTSTNTVEATKDDIWSRSQSRFCLEKRGDESKGKVTEPAGSLHDQGLGNSQEMLTHVGCVAEAQAHGPDNEDHSTQLELGLKDTVNTGLERSNGREENAISGNGVQSLEIGRDQEPPADTSLYDDIWEAPEILP